MFFFFKQKTAYEMRISDWSSDVCSSDLAEGKVTEEFDGVTYLRERWLRADLAIIKAWRADPEGNLVFRKTARNFNPDMATAANATIAEVEEVVPAGELDPDHRSEEHTSEIQSLMRTSYSAFFLKTQNNTE